MSIVLAGNSAVVGSGAGDTQASAGTLDVTTGSEGEPQQLSETPTLIAGNVPARKLFLEWTSDVTVVEYYGHS
jgi:hypothetical protein